MVSLQQIAAALGGEVRRNGVLCPGPGHSAQDRSLSVKLGGDDFIVHSFASDDPMVCRDYVRGKLGMPAFQPSHLNGQKARKPAAAPARKKRGVPVATYPYQDKDGKTVFEVVRTVDDDGEKGFFQRVPKEGGGYSYELKGIAPVLYQLPLLSKYPDASPIFLTEGEKDAETVIARGYVATTPPGWVKKWPPELVEPLRGRDVVIAVDNDKAGEIKAIEAAEAVCLIAASVRLVRFTDMAPKADVSDYFEAGHTNDQFDERWREAPLYVPGAEPEEPKNEPDKPPLTQSSAEFAAALSPPDFLIDGVLQRRFLYCLTAQTGTGKTAIALFFSALSDLRG
jgi:hypothetical protein